MRSPRWRPLLAIFMAFGLLTAACGDDDGDATPAESPEEEVTDEETTEDDEMSDEEMDDEMTDEEMDDES